MTNTARAGQQPAAIKVLDSYDATAHVGLRVIVRGAAVERVDGTCEATIELPKLNELRATAAMMRCLMPERLHGAEIKAMRKIMGLTLAGPSGSTSVRRRRPCCGGKPTRNRWAAMPTRCCAC